MAYGVKRGIKAPGQFGVSDIFGLGLAGAAGIISALVTDYQQKGEASALYTINQWVAALGDMMGFAPAPLWMVVAGIVSVGAGSIFYFQPITRQGAFAQGFGLLAVLMTAVPADLAGGLQPTGTVSDLQPMAASREAAANPTVVNAAFSSGDARTYQAQVQAQQGARYVVELSIIFPGGVPADIDNLIRRGTIRGRLHNKDANETYNLFRTAGGDMVIRGDELVIRAGVPAKTPEGTLWVRIECNGYAIEEQSAQASTFTPLAWTINMRPSSVPLFLQRLGKSYWF
ncbi:MAG: hypothetical protein R3C51_06645 [Parvularculaceae bacterium]